MSVIGFTKMHGLGNDYVFVDGAAYDVADPPGLARVIAPPHTGIGADGLILMLPPREAGSDLRMRIFNADGSESEMCGNGLRCVCKYAYEHGLSAARPMRIETGAGPLVVDYEVGPDGTVDEVTIDMGAPRFDLEAVRADPAHLAVRADATTWGIEVAGATLEAVLVSTGNPHAVIYVEDVAAIALDRLGPAVEHHAAFPHRINAHFVEIDDATRIDEITMRTWERGSGATRACGTGAAAVCVAGVRTGRTGPDLLAHLPGGDLRLRFDPATGHVHLTGPATEVFSGEWAEHPTAGCQGIPARPGSSEVRASGRRASSRSPAPRPTAPRR